MSSNLEGQMIEVDINPELQNDQIGGAGRRPRFGLPNLRRNNANPAPTASSTTPSTAHAYDKQCASAN